MAPTRRSSGPGKEKQRPARKELNGGAWTAEEDQKLAEAVGIHGAKQWRIIAAKAGLNRCAKSCRLRWMNYVRPNMKRGNISDQEEDLISRLHKLLGNRWSLIAGRLPGRTGDEIKNYWNCHLSKKKFEQEAIVAEISAEERAPKSEQTGEENGESTSSEAQGTESRFDANDFFDFSNENPSTVEWITEFLEFGARS